jgi:hypothetical protein
MQSDYFKNEWLPRRASTLAANMTNVLKSVFQLQQLEEPIIGEVLESLETHVEVLKGIFNCALLIKTKALVTTTQFQLIFPTTGSEYVPKLMDLDDEDILSNEATGNHNVRLCVSPGLRKCSFPRTRVADLDFCNDQCLSSEDTFTIAKACVILE